MEEDGIFVFAIRQNGSFILPLIRGGSEAEIPRRTGRNFRKILKKLRYFRE